MWSIVIGFICVLICPLMLTLYVLADILAMGLKAALSGIVKLAQAVSLTRRAA